MFTIFHFFSDLAKKRKDLADKKIKLEDFPFDKDMLSIRQKGKFPDMAIRVNKTRTDNPLLCGGELLELKETKKAYGIASFNSTIPTGEKDVKNLPNLLRNMADNGDDPEALPMRQVYYLLRGWDGRDEWDVKVCLVHGSFFETVKVKELISSAFRQALEAASEGETSESLSEEEKDKMSRLLSKQDIFSSSRHVENASVSLRFRIMTEVRKEANILKVYPEIGENTLSFVVPVHGKTQDERAAEARDIADAMKTAGAPRGAGEPFFIKHPFNGYFWVIQCKIPKKKHPWTEEDEIIALDGYLSTLKGVLRDTAADRAVDLVNIRSLRDGVPGFNDSESMKMKFDNNKFLDKKGGLDHPSELNKEVWEKYHDAPEELKKSMAKIKEALTKK